MWDKETEEAIIESVRHWEENVDILKESKSSEELSLGPHYCPLCKKFNIGRGFFNENNCIYSCPLALRNMHCPKDKSPYQLFYNNKTVENAQNMVLALKSLFYPEPKKEVFYEKGQIWQVSESTYLSHNELGYFVIEKCFGVDIDKYNDDYPRFSGYMIHDNTFEYVDRIWSKYFVKLMNKIKEEK